MLQIAFSAFFFLLREVSEKVFHPTWTAFCNQFYLNQFLTPSIDFTTGLFSASLAMNLCMLEIKNNSNYL